MFHYPQANSEMDSALSAKLELEAKLGSVADERKALLERCLAAESELDREGKCWISDFQTKFCNGNNEKW